MGRLIVAAAFPRGTWMMSEAGTEAEGVVVAVVSPDVTALRARLVQSELKAEAIRAGMVDLDGVKLIDPAVVKVDANGDLVDGAGVMSALRVAKPWLFGRGSSSSAAVAPRAEPPKAKTAMQMSVEEWRAARAELLRQR